MTSPCDRSAVIRRVELRARDYRVRCYACGSHVTFARTGPGFGAWWASHRMPWLEGWTLEDSAGHPAQIVTRIRRRW